MFGRSKDEKPAAGTETEVKDGDTTSQAPQEDFDAPPLKPFAKSGSHHATPKPPAAPSRNAESTRRNTNTDIPGAPRRSGRGSSNGDSGKRLTVGRDICLNGEISACEKLVVEGSVEAQLSEAVMIEVASTGTFKGKADVENADISGLYDGDLTVRGKLTIRPGGQIKGKVRYSIIVIEAGGQVNGSMEALPDAIGSDDDASSSSV
ncbi:MAG: polymer-forming cytoskeletal protein [Alphaproteobacteria bacterium]|nr:polymer-forming cytoskeletal protein [Rhodospirillales bacterium]MCW9044879.1 polymer-forming cytoskeletal protein [Alphaproteobacteria bacterium]